MIMAKSKSPGVMKGLDVGQIIAIEDDDPEDVPSSTAHGHATRTRLNGRTDNRLYDMKYHPMDDVTHPNHAAKRGHIAPAAPSNDDDGEDSSDDESIGTLKSSSWSEDDMIPTSTERAPHPMASRQSSRPSTAKAVNYDSKVRPQDNILAKFGLLKRKKLHHKSPTENKKQTTVKRQKTSNSPTPFTSPLQADKPIIRYAEGMEVWKLKPGERYFAHHDDALYHGSQNEFRTGKKLVPHSGHTNNGDKDCAMREVIGNSNDEDEHTLCSKPHEEIEPELSVVEEDVGFVLGQEDNPPADSAEASDEEADNDERQDHIDQELLALADSNSESSTNSPHEGKDSVINPELPVLRVNRSSSEANELTESQVDASIHRTISALAGDDSASNASSQDLRFVQSTIVSTQKVWDCVVHQSGDTASPRATSALESVHRTVLNTSTTATEKTGTSRRHTSDRSDTSNRNWSVLHARSMPMLVEGVSREASTAQQRLLPASTDSSRTLSKRSCSVPQTVPPISYGNYPARFHARHPKNKSGFDIFEDTGSVKDNLAARAVTRFITQDDYPKENVMFALSDAEAAIETSPDVPPRSAQLVRQRSYLSDCEESARDSQKSDNATDSGPQVEHAYSLFSQMDPASSFQEKNGEKLPDTDPIGSNPEFLPSGDAGFESEACAPNYDDESDGEDENNQNGITDQPDGSLSLSGTTLQDLSNVTCAGDSRDLAYKSSDRSLIIETFHNARRAHAKKCRHKFGVDYTDLPHHEGKGYSHSPNHDEGFTNGGAQTRANDDARLVETNAPIIAGDSTFTATGRSIFGPYSDDTDHADAETRDIMDTEDRHLQEAGFGTTRIPNLP